MSNQDRRSANGFEEDAEHGLREREVAVKEGELGLKQIQQSLETDKWQSEKALREHDLAIKESELELKRTEQASSGWRNPLVVAILAATLAAGGNAVVALVNGRLQRNLEEQRSEETRILEMIKTNDPDKAAANLEFLLKSGLIDDPDRARKIQKFLSSRAPGTGPTLPSAAGSVLNSYGDAVAINTLPSNSKLRIPARAVGQVRGVAKEGLIVTCSAFLIAEDLALTADHCVRDVEGLEFIAGDSRETFSANVVEADQGLDYAFMRLVGKPGAQYGVLNLSATVPAISELLTMIYYRGTPTQLVDLPFGTCRVLSVERSRFTHGCTSGAGSTGAPMLSTASDKVVGMHVLRDQNGPGVAVLVSTILDDVRRKNPSLTREILK